MNAKFDASSPKCWIDSLPDEIIASILVINVTPSLDEHIDLAYRVRFPVVIQYVCKRWRIISLNTPALWTTLHFRKSSNDDILSRFQRSGTLPLEVHLEPLSTNNPMPDDSFRFNLVLILALQTNVYRIWNLDIHGGLAVEIQETLQHLPPHFPNLLRLTIKGMSHDEPENSQLPLTAPRLSSLHITHYSPDWASLPIASTLQELHILDSYATAVSLRLLVETLRQAPRLRSLKLAKQLITEWEEFESIEPVILTELESLSLKEFYRRELRRIFYLVRTPHVRKLLIQARYKRDRLIERDRTPELDLPELERLTLCGVYLSAEIVKQLPSVKHLALHYAHRTAPLPSIILALDYIFSTWRSLSKPLPLETLEVEGVPLSRLLALLQQDKHDLVPSLRTIQLRSSDVLLGCLNSKAEFRIREEEHHRLAKLVKLEITGDPTNTDSPLFRTWEEREAWIAASSAKTLQSTQ